LTAVNLPARTRTIYFRVFSEQIAPLLRWSAGATTPIGTRPRSTENIMRHQLHAYAIALTLFGSAGLAAAQSPDQPSTQSGTQGRLDLNQGQERAVMQGLRSEQTQPAPSGSQAQVGSQVPDSVTPHAMPGDVTAQVPETKSYLFVKLPDRVLIIDPDSKTIAQIILTSDTTGSGPDTGSTQSGSSGQR